MLKKIKLEKFYGGAKPEILPTSFSKFAEFCYVFDTSVDVIHEASLSDVFDVSAASEYPPHWKNFVDLRRSNDNIG